MTSATSRIPVRLRLREQPLDFVWSAWRALTPRHFYYAALAGLGLGFVGGTGIAMATHSFRGTLVASLPNVVHALVLLLCLSVAADVRVRPSAKWTPFAIAVTIATVITGFATWVITVSLYGGWSAALYTNLIPTWLLSLLAGFGYMYGLDAMRRTDALRSLQLQRTRVAREAYERRLKALQARVEPRFLFDTLSDIEAAYAANPESGQRLIDDLIVYLRTALPAIEATSSSLGAELELVRTWLEIVRIRSGERLLFAMPDVGTPLDARMPPMLLLPLVQHAAEDGNGATRAIFISATIKDTRIRVTIIGSASAFVPSNHSPAIIAVRERLEALYGDLATLTMLSALHDRSQATLEIPYEPADRRPR